MVLIYSELNLVSICWTGKFLLLFHSLSNLIRLHEMLCPDHWRLASSQERHIIVLILGKLTWNYDKWAPQLSWRRHQLYTLVALVVCALLLWTIPARLAPWTPVCGRGRWGLGRSCQPLYGTYCLESPPWAWLIPDFVTFRSWILMFETCCSSNETEGSYSKIHHRVGAWYPGIMEKGMATHFSILPVFSILGEFHE